MKGALCISLDFEKFWGIHDRTNIKDNEQHLIKVNEIVGKLLALFTKYDIHCTWAVVGLLNFNSLNELENYCKSIAINYDHTDYSPFPLSKYHLKNVNQNSFLAKIEIEEIKKTPNQEIASHTFSHLYTIEKGITEKDFQNDIDNFKATIGEVNTVIFPRNQINQNYLNLLSKGKRITYRGNQENKFWKNSQFKTESFLKKAGRVIDAYIKISKDNLINWRNLKQNNSINIPASRFLRPVQFNNTIENIKLKRIKKQMLAAAEQNKIYHLWWHPHNFSKNTEENFKQLENLLIYYTQLNKAYHFQSLNMNEISKSIE